MTRDPADLADWLLEQITEAEEGAQRATQVIDGTSAPSWMPTLASFLLNDYDAKRRIVSEFQRCGPSTQGYSGLRFAVQCLALPFAHRPGYREDWRP